MADKEKNLKKTIGFLEDSLEMVNFLNTNCAYEKYFKDKIKNLNRRFPNLEEPEKDYLKSLERRYFKTFSVNSQRKN